MPPVMSSDEAGVPWLGVCARLLERHRSPRFRDALDLFGQLEIDVPVQQHVVFLVQLAGANVFVAHIRRTECCRWSSV